MRRLAKEDGVDLTQVRPTGKFDRILEENVLNYLETGRSATGTSASKEPPQPARKSVQPVDG